MTSGRSPLLHLCAPHPVTLHEGDAKTFIGLSDLLRRLNTDVAAIRLFETGNRVDRKACRLGNVMKAKVKDGAGCPALGRADNEVHDPSIRCAETHPTPKDFRSPLLIFTNGEGYDNPQPLVKHPTLVRRTTKYGEKIPAGQQGQRISLNV